MVPAGVDGSRGRPRRSLAAARFVSARGERFDSFALDIEASLVRNAGERTRRLLALSARMRSAVGPAYRLGAIIPSPVGMRRLRHYWPGFPYAGLARIYDAFVPMAYYSARADTAAEVARYAQRSIAIIREESGRPGVPIHIIGGMASATSTSDAAAFVRTSVSCGVAGFSLYDYGGTNPALWRVLANPGRAAAAGLASGVQVGVQLPEVEREVRWPELVAMARAAEAAGFDSIWVGDHMLYRGDGRPERGPWDVWTMLAALAASTERVRLGPLVASLAFHPPGLVARMAAAIDEVSRRPLRARRRRGLERDGVPRVRDPVRPSGGAVRGGVRDRAPAARRRARHASRAGSTRSRTPCCSRARRVACR